MSATALRRSQVGSRGVPLTQNTAPVIEFRCLYTHDVRRKSKRWQDGFVKFHTFNKRIMVYDVPRNFIGDLHWKDQGEIQEGDEITLESAVLVQVNEPIERTETDLTPLFKKRDDGSAKKAVGMQDRTRHSGAPQVDRAGAPSHNRHKSLHALLGTSKGPHGKAVLPTRSPFEMRSSDKEDDWPDRHSAKRRKVAAPDETFTVVHTTKAPKKVEEPGLSRNANARPQSPSPRKSRKENPGFSPRQSRLNVRNVIVIPSDTEHPSSEPGPTMPPAPTSGRRAQRQTLRPAAPSRQTTVSTVSRVIDRGLSEAIASRRLNSPPISTTNKVDNVQPRTTSPEPDLAQMRPPQSERKGGRSLKCGKKSSRNMLMCQDLPRKMRVSKENEFDIIGEENDQSSSGKPERSDRSNQDRRPIHKKTEPDRVPESIVRKRKKKRQQSTDTSLGPATIYEASVDRNTTSDYTFPSLSTNDFAVTVAQMDRQQLHLPQPAGPQAYPPGHEPEYISQRIQSENCKFPPPMEAPENPPEVARSNLEQARERAVVEDAVLKQPFQKPRPGSGRVHEKGRGDGKTTEGVDRKGEERTEDVNLGPWSREAWDLFDWKPPDRDENGRKVEIAVDG